MDELKAMTSVSQALEAISEKDAQKRVLMWAWSKFIGEGTPLIESSGGKSSNGRRKSKQAGSPSVARKQSYEQVKTLNLKPQGKMSLQEFADSKNPFSNVQKITVAVYYLTEVFGEEAVSINHVYTCFKWMKWRLPSNLKNTIHQVGARGLMDTKNGDDLRLTHMGENLVEHELGS